MAPKLFSLVLASGLLASRVVAQNLTEVIANATQFAFPEQNLTSVTIEYYASPPTYAGLQSNATVATVRERVTYFTIDGLAIIDGDVIFGTEAELLAHVVPDNGPSTVPHKRGEHKHHAPRFHGGPSKRAVSLDRDDPRRWPGGVVSYYWESQATKDAREEMFLRACKIWTDRLPFLKFINVGIQATTTEGGPIILKLSDKGVSSSPVGRASSAGGNYMVLGTTSNPGVYVHEIGHTLGLKHEQQRPDRDAYMTVDCSKVCGKYIYKPPPNEDEVDHCEDADCGDSCTGYGCNFKKVPVVSDVWDWSGPYDVLSIMQYGSSLFARPETNWEDPITVVDPRIPLRRGNGRVPTLTDAQRVCAIYHEDCRGVCGDGILSLNNFETCDDGNNDDGDGCSASCAREYCGDGIVQPQLGEVCDDGPLGSPTCTAACKRPCLDECVPDPNFNRCHITTSCIRIEGGSASAGKHYCACAHGFRANGVPPADQSAQIRLPWLGQEGRVFVKPGLECNILCDEWTLGKDGCKEVVESNVCY